MLRRVGCKWDSLCLQKAIDAGERDFSCEGCQIFVGENLSEKEQIDQLLGCARLLFEVFPELKEIYGDPKTSTA